MTVQVTISINGKDHVMGVSKAALDIVRSNFNPSAFSSVDHAKVLGAALITLMEPTRDARGEGGRCAALAITQAETATMFAVKALTAGS